MHQQFGLVIDLERCVECHACTVACKIHNKIELGKFLTQVLPVGPKGIHPNVGRYAFPKVCMQCEQAPCEKACPTKATRHDERGIVVIDEEQCIGCKYCMIACPYGARSYNKERGVVQKCQLCVERLNIGKQPVCVNTCLGGARIFGDLNDPTSEAFKRAHEPGAFVMYEELGTCPVTRYCAP